MQHLEMVKMIDGIFMYVIWENKEVILTGQDYDCITV